jgi:hypothetical protein
MQILRRARVGIAEEIGGKTLMLGSAEIQVAGKGDRIYVAPDLIYHYIAVHQYLPPAEFLDAVRAHT